MTTYYYLLSNSIIEALSCESPAPLERRAVELARQGKTAIIAKGIGMWKAVEVTKHEAVWEPMS